MRKKYQKVVGRNVPKAKISLFFFRSSTIQVTPTRMILHNTGGKKGGGERERQTEKERLENDYC